MRSQWKVNAFRGEPVVCYLWLCFVFAVYSNFKRKLHTLNLTNKHTHTPVASIVMVLDVVFAVLLSNGCCWTAPILLILASVETFPFNTSVVDVCWKSVSSAVVVPNLLEPPDWLMMRWCRSRPNTMWTKLKITRQDYILPVYFFVICVWRGRCGKVNIRKGESVSGFTLCYFRKDVVTRPDRAHC